jgi:hypothetical protein
MRKLTFALPLIRAAVSLAAQEVSVTPASTEKLCETPKQVL